MAPAIIENSSRLVPGQRSFCLHHGQGKLPQGKSLGRTWWTHAGQRGIISATLPSFDVIRLPAFGVKRKDIKMVEMSENSEGMRRGRDVLSLPPYGTGSRALGSAFPKEPLSCLKARRGNSSPSRAVLPQRRRRGQTGLVGAGLALPPIPTPFMTDEIRGQGKPSPYETCHPPPGVAVSPFGRVASGQC